MRIWRGCLLLTYQLTRLLTYQGLLALVARRSGNVVGRISEVAVRRARLVLRWVTVYGYIILVWNQPLCQLTLLPSAGRELRTSQEAVAVLCGREGNRRSDVALAVRHRRCGVST